VSSSTERLNAWLQLPTLSHCGIHFNLTEVRLRSFLASPHFLQVVPAPPPLHFCLARAKFH